MHDQDLINGIRDLFPKVINLNGPDHEIDTQINKILGTRDLKPTHVLEDVNLVLQILYPEDMLHIKGPAYSSRSPRHDQWYCWTESKHAKDGEWGDTAAIAALKAIWSRASN